MGERHAGVTIAASISFGFLLVLVFMSYSKPVDKVFGLENFFIGDYGASVDPKQQYDATYQNVIAGASACITTMSRGKNPRLAGQGVWIVDGETVEKIKDLKPTDDTNTEIKPFREDGMKILAPAELKFINANTIQYEKDKINITAQIGLNLIIEFDDVKCWWCHIGKIGGKHSEKVGSGGTQETCVEGYIIGEAKKETVVRLYQLNEEGERVPYSFEEFFLK